MLSRLHKYLLRLLAQERHAPALHEAAYVVVGIRCGMPIHTVDIIQKVVHTLSDVMGSTGSATYIVQHVESAFGSRAMHARVVFAAELSALNVAWREHGTTAATKLHSWMTRLASSDSHSCVTCRRSSTRRSRSSLALKRKSCCSPTAGMAGCD